jgi:hypothetical protein
VRKRKAGSSGFALGHFFLNADAGTASAEGASSELQASEGGQAGFARR